MTDTRFYSVSIICENCGLKSREVLWRAVALTDLECPVCAVKALRRNAFARPGEPATEQEAVEAGLIEYPGEVG